jgi:hypothetical protein
VSLPRFLGCGKVNTRQGFPVAPPLQRLADEYGRCRLSNPPSRSNASGEPKACNFPIYNPYGDSEEKAAGWGGILEAAASEAAAAEGKISEEVRSDQASK